VVSEARKSQKWAFARDGKASDITVGRRRNLSWENEPLASFCSPSYIGAGEAP
jgi:hypothetical protein